MSSVNSSHLKIPLPAWRILSTWNTLISFIHTAVVIVVVNNNNNFQKLSAYQVLTIHIISFNQLYNPVRYYLCSTDEEIGSDLSTWPRAHS